MTTHNTLLLRCLIEREGNLYIAHCIDLGLGVQGDSEVEVQGQLHEAIDGYLRRVVEIHREGDPQTALRLLHRHSPLSIRLKYFRAWLRSSFHRPSPPRPTLWAEDRPDPLACV